MASRSANHGAAEKHPSENLISRQALKKLIKAKDGFFPTISHLKQDGGYPRSALALIVEKCEDYRNPYRHDFVTIADIARMANRNPINVAGVLKSQGQLPDMKVGRPFYAKARVPALLELLDSVRRNHPDFLSAQALARHLQTHQMTLLKAIRDEIIIPDRMNADGAYQFRRDRLPEFEQLWKRRLELYPAWASVKAVITPYGMMLPRVAPRGEVFAPEMLQKPERPLHVFFSKKTAFYNLSDLNGSPSDRPSKTIFASTSLKSVRTCIGKKSRRRI